MSLALNEPKQVAFHLNSSSTSKDAGKRPPLNCGSEMHENLLCLKTYVLVVC